MRGALARFFGATGTALGGLLALLALATGTGQPLGCWVGPGAGCESTGHGYLLVIGLLLATVGIFLLVRSGLPAELRGEEPA